MDRQLVTGVAWLGSVKWLIQLVTWAASLITMRLLSPADFGTVTAGGVFLSLVALLSESGIATTIVTVRTLTSEDIERINSAALLLAIVGYVALAAGAVGASAFFHQPALPPVLLALGITLLLAGLRIVPNAVLQRDFQFRQIAVLDASQAIVQAVATVALVIAGFKYWSLVIGAVLGAVLLTAGTLRVRRVRFRYPHWSALRPVLGFTSDVVIGRLCWFLNQNADFATVGHRLGQVALGAYSYAWTLASIPVDKITGTVNGVMGPVFAATQHDRVALRRYFFLITEALATVVTPLAIGLALVAHDFVRVVLGTRWLPMTTALVLLAMYAPVRAITPPLSQVLMVTGNSRYGMYWSAVAAVLLPLGFTIASRWGIVGVAAAWAIVHPLTVLLPMLVRALRAVDAPARAYLAALWPCTSAVAIMSAAVVAVERSMPADTTRDAVVRLALSALVGAGTYTGVIFVAHRDRLRAFRELVGR